MGPPFVGARLHPEAQVKGALTHQKSTAFHHLLALAFFFTSTILLTWPLVRRLGSAIPGDGFDGWQNYWNLWWLRTAILDLHTHPYFTSALYHPTGVSLWFQTLNVFNGLVSLPVQLAANLFWAYNAIVLFSFTVAGYGAAILTFYILRRGGARRDWRLWLSGITAGIVFTFSPFHFAHLLGHMQVFSLEFAPFYVLYLLRSTARTSQDNAKNTIRYHDALLAAFFLILCGLCDWYLVLYLTLFTALYLLWLLLRRQLRISHLLTLALTFGVFLLVTAPLTLPMVIESLRYDYMRPPPGQITQLSADLLGFLIPSGQHPWWGAWAARLRANLPASPSENTVYLGLIPLLLALYALWRRRVRLGFWAITALIFALFALGPVLHVGGAIVTLPGGQPFSLPYALLLHLPFLDIARTVARYDLVVMLCLGVLAGGGMYTLLLDRPHRWLAALGIGLLLCEFAPLPYPISQPDIPTWYNTLAADPRPGAVLNLPMTWDRPIYLLAQTVHDKPLTAGYISRNDPRTYPERLPVLSDFRHGAPDINAVDPATYAPTLFDFAGIRWVVIDRYQMPLEDNGQPGSERAQIDALIPAIFQGHPPIYVDDRLSVYETWSPDQRLPFIELGYDWGPLLPGPARQMETAATVIIHSPDGAPQTLVVTPAADNTIPYHLRDAAGQEIGASPGSPARFTLTLHPGPNRFLLIPDRPGLTIHQLRLEPTPDLASFTLSFSLTESIYGPGAGASHIA